LAYDSAAKKSNYGREKNQSIQQIYSGGITANHSPKADARYMASQSTGVVTDE